MQISQQTIHLHLTTPSASMPLRVSQQALQFHVTSPVASAPLRISQQTLGVHFMPAVAPVLRVSLPDTTLRLACVGPPGTEGPAGPPGADGIVLGAFMIANRFSELDLPQAKLEARTNLELNHIDCGEYL